MFTRCPDCHTVHPLNSALLSHAGGSVRCGRCKKRFDALQTLFDAWPDPGDAPTPRKPGAVPPVLGIRIDVDPEDSAGKPGHTDEEAPGYQDNGTPKPAEHQGSWILVVVALVLVTLVHLGWSFRGPLLAVPGMGTLLENAGLAEPVEEQPYREPAMIRLVSRDMHSHPSRTGTLVLSATIVNLAPRTQPLPDLDVTLLNAGGVPVATRLFKPSEYLPPGADDSMTLDPDVYLPLLLEFIDPGETAVGFELDFH